MRTPTIIIAMLLTACAIAFSSCYRTRTDTKEEQRLQRIRDSILADSINMVRQTPDTVLATYKRSMFCDKEFMIVFDRVKVLSGKEAAEYSLRHKRFGNNVNVVVNQEVTLETLPLDSTAPVLIYSKVPNANDSSRFHYEYRQGDNESISNLPYEQVIEIIIKERKIVSLRQREL